MTNLVKIQSTVVRKEQSDYGDGNCFNIIVGFSNRCDARITMYVEASSLVAFTIVRLLSFVW